MTIVLGTREADTLRVRDGETVYALAGADTLRGQPGRDGGIAFGGAGDDTFYDAGSTLYGGAGSDDFGSEMFAFGHMPDVVFGGDGDDAASLSTGEELDSSIYRTAYGGAGNDLLYASRIFGGTGEDRIGGDQTASFLSGGSGDDTIGDGPSVASDHLDFGGRDRLYGQEGNDLLDGADDSDTAFGGTGHDRLFGGAAETADLLSGGDDTLFGGDGDDRIQALDAVDRVYGGAGRDLVFGGDADDRLSGGDGADRLIGGWGDDRLAGGDGDDLCVFAGTFGADRVAVDGGGTDTLLLRGFAPAAVSVATAGADLVVTVTGGGTIRLQGHATAASVELLAFDANADGIVDSTVSLADLP